MLSCPSCCLHLLILGSVVQFGNKACLVDSSSSPTEPLTLQSHLPNNSNTHMVVELGLCLGIVGTMPAQQVNAMQTEVVELQNAL